MTEETRPAFNMGIGGRLMSPILTGTGVGTKPMSYHIYLVLIV